MHISLQFANLTTWMYKISQASENRIEIPYRSCTSIELLPWPQHQCRSME